MVAVVAHHPWVSHPAHWLHPSFLCFPRVAFWVHHSSLHSAAHPKLSIIISPTASLYESSPLHTLNPNNPTTCAHPSPSQHCPGEYSIS